MILAHGKIKGFGCCIKQNHNDASGLKGKQILFKTTKLWQLLILQDKTRFEGPILQPVNIHVKYMSMYSYDKLTLQGVTHIHNSCMIN